jgi:transcriptional regulator GlxA family with amidase domain
LATSIARHVATEHRCGKPYSLSITDVAPSCGFSIMAQFSRVFRAHMGAAPSDYRRAVRLST